jgi:hypothetical protein
MASLELLNIVSSWFSHRTVFSKRLEPSVSSSCAIVGLEVGSRTKSRTPKAQKAGIDG